MKIKELIGHSGCRIELFERDGRFVVRKTAQSSDYNQRLFRQCHKQRHYRNPVFRAPEVYSWDYHKGLFVFEMEYIKGLALHEYFRSLDVGKISGLAELFTENVICSTGQPSISNDRLQTKIRSLQNSITGKDNRITAAFDMLNSFSWPVWHSCDCHGDMTFENIIYNDGTFYLIDFLDSFADSWLMDIAKLFQDLEAYWSYRNGPLDQNVRLRCHLLRNMMVNKILLMDDGPALVLTVYHLLLLNLLRIVPYTKSKHIRKVVDNGIDRTITVLQQMLKDYDYGYVDNSMCRQINEISQHETQVAANASGWRVDDPEGDQRDGPVSL